MSGIVESSADARSKTIGQNFRVRAWVNFDGGSGSGTGSSDITIYGSGNVSSVTDGGTGKYQINFTTPMEDIYFSAAAGGYFSAGDSAGTTAVQIRRVAFTTGTVGIRGVPTDAGTFNDLSIATVTVFH